MNPAATIPETAAPLPVTDVRERDYVRNVLCLTAVETGWGFGMAFGFSASFVQVVLRNLGATEGQVGLLAAQWGIGTIPMVLAGYFTGHLRRKKSVVLWGHYLCVVPVALLAMALAWVPGNSAKIWCILAAEFAFSLSVGILLPIWLTFMGKVMPPGKLGRGFGITFACQTLAGALAAWIASIVLTRNPGAVAACVAVTAGIMAFANIFFIGVKEPDTAGEARAQAFWPWLRETFRELRTHTMFRNLLIAEILFSSQSVVVGFYAARAADFGATAATGARFSAWLALTQAFSAFIGGWLVDRIGPKPVLIAGRLAVVVAAAFALTAHSVAGLFPAAICVGVFFGVRSTAGFAMFRAVTGREEVTSLYGIFTLLVAPVAAAAPILAGALMGRQLLAPTTAFAIAGSLVLLSTLVLGFGVKSKPATQG